MDFKKFQQFKPKSVKEILEESKERQTSKMKEFADVFETNIREYLEYLKENNSATKILRGDDDWNPSGATFNQDGNKIMYYDVVGGDGDNTINMDTRTHDTINGGKGGDTIYGGWGNDVITGGTNTRRGWSDWDVMRGEEGNDIITAHSGDRAYGGIGRDELRGYSNSQLEGGEDSDIFKIFTRDVGEGNDDPVIVEDFSSEDKIVVDFTGNGARFDELAVEMWYFEGWEAGIKTFVYDENERAVAMINEVDLDDYNVEVGGNGMSLTITGSDFM